MLYQQLQATNLSDFGIKYYCYTDGMEVATVGYNSEYYVTYDGREYKVNRYNVDVSYDVPIATGCSVDLWEAFTQVNRCYNYRLLYCLI